MIVGYRISGYDNGTVMFTQHDLAGMQRCSGCGYRTDFFAHNPRYRQGRKRRSDLLYTYDGVPIVTRNFRSYFTDRKYEGVRFLEFEQDPDHFHLQVDRIVPFNAVKRETRFEDYCNVCGNYESVVGATPAYLDMDEPLRDGLYRSDLLFASGNGKHPLLIVGCVTRERMEAAGLKGILFEEATN